MTPETLISPAVEERVKRVAGYFSIDRQDFDDLCQELRLELFRHCEDSEPLAIVYLKCWSKAYRYWKKAETYANHINTLFTDAEADQREETYATLLSDFLGGLHPGDSIEEEISKREEMEIIKIIVTTLTPRHQKIFMLRYSGMSTREIERRLGLHRTAISKTQLPKIRAAFANHHLAARLFTEAIPS